MVNMKYEYHQIEQQNISTLNLSYILRGVPYELNHQEI